MRRICIFILLLSLSVANSFAQSGPTGFVANGYYRICNLATSRYIYVTDNKDYYNKASDTEDFQAIQLWKDITKAVSSPASVVFIEQQVSNPKNYDLRAQGTGVHALTGMYVQVINKTTGVYEVSATRLGVTKYLSDDRTNNSARGKMGTRQEGAYRMWVVDKIETNHANNYFGIKPTIQVNGKYYQPFFAAFPFKLASSGMRVYYISQIKDNEATMKEILSGEVPAKTPVIIECSSTEPTNNRLDLLNSSSATVAGNKLAGVYFCNGERPAASKDAYTAFDAATMRVLTVSDGKLVMSNNASDRLEEVEFFDEDTEEEYTRVCIPANTCYLKADAGTPAKLNIVIDGTGIDEILAENKDNSVEGVYTLSGAQLRATNDVRGLPAGLYIVGGHKFVVK